MKFSKSTIEKMLPILAVLLSCLLMYNHAHANLAEMPKVHIQSK